MSNYELLWDAYWEGIEDFKKALGTVSDVAKSKNDWDEYESIIVSVSGASSDYQLDALKALIEKGADINETCDDSSPLHEASHECDSNVVSWLIEHGADFNLDLGDGYRPVIAAIRSDNAETLKTLIDAGADLNFTYFDDTPAAVADNKDSPECLKVLS